MSVKEKCPKCGGSMRCLAGKPAHAGNWYCRDEDGCGWEAWSRPPAPNHTLKRCPCGEVPKEISAVTTDPKGKWMYAVPLCCGVWRVRFLSEYTFAHPKNNHRAEANTAWNDAPRGGGWIDVVDELPKEAQEVLFVRDNKVVFGAWIGGIFWHNNQKMAAAFWMPMPPPPMLINAGPQG